MKMRPQLKRSLPFCRSRSALRPITPRDLAGQLRLPGNLGAKPAGVTQCGCWHWHKLAGTVFGGDQGQRRVASCIHVAEGHSQAPGPALGPSFGGA